MIDYSMDFSQFTLAEFWDILRNQRVLPGRRILLQDLDQRYDWLSAQGVRTLEDLAQALKTGKGVERMAVQWALPVDYLTILRREVFAWRPNPVALQRFPGLDPEQVATLARLGLKQSRQFLERGATRAGREVLARESGLPLESLEEMARLCDLVRMVGVGPLFARLFLDAGVRSVEQTAPHTPDELFAKLDKANREHQRTKARFAAKELTCCLKQSRRLPIILEA